jgi:hypothetical protein
LRRRSRIANAGEKEMVRVLENILSIPAIALAIGIAVVGVIHVYKYVKYELSKD